jgi:predicted AAA+ superfamily ATPase
MLFHYRDRDQLEVDFILENAAGEIVGIEVKSAASVTRPDFLGLERVASAAGTAGVRAPGAKPIMPESERSATKLRS